MADFNEADPEASFASPTAAPPNPDAGSWAADAQGTKSGATSGASGAAGGPGNDEDEEDDMPDYSTLEALLDARAGKASGPKSSASKDDSAAAFLPKRGEKDFEPTGFAGQAKALARSRATMYRAISGQRIAVARTMGHAVVDPVTRCATVTVTRRRVFEQTGVTIKAWPPHMRPPSHDQSSAQVTAIPEARGADGEQAQSDPKAQSKVPSLSCLFPEETLYLLERGSLICHLPVPVPPGGQAPQTSDGKQTHQQLVPLSIEQASSLLLAPSTAAAQQGTNYACTREQYQVYVYLKRLGYIVQRADVVDQLRATAAETRERQAQQAALGNATVQTTSTSPIQSLRTIIISPFVLVFRSIQNGLRALGSQLVLCPMHATSVLIHRLVRGVLALTKPRRRSCGLLGLGLRTGHPESYNEAFAALQFIPTYRASQEKKITPDLKPFFYAWRPATAYKRTDPPPPEFRVAIVNGSERNLLDLTEFAQLFEQVPLPPREGLDKQRADEVVLQNRNAYGRQAAWAAARAKAQAQGLPPPPDPATQRRTPPTAQNPKWYMRFWPLTWLNSTPTPRPRQPNPFPPLKSGQRNMIVAVVDEGTTSIFRFGQSDFPGHKLAGI